MDCSSLGHVAYPKTSLDRVQASQGSTRPAARVPSDLQEIEKRLSSVAVVLGQAHTALAGPTPESISKEGPPVESITGQLDRISYILSLVQDRAASVAQLLV